MKMITACTLHNSGGSDEGTAFALAAIDHVKAELEERGVEPPMPLGEMKWKEVIDQLRMDEYHLLVELELAWDIEHWSKVT